MAAPHARSGAELPGLLFTARFEGLIAEREARLSDSAAVLTMAYETVIGSARMVQIWLAADLVRVSLAGGDAGTARRVSGEIMASADEIVRVPSAEGTALLCCRSATRLK